MHLKELANLCGVSQSTVSRVLNGYSGNFSVKPEIRERILKTAQDMGFVPNPVYQALRSRKNNLAMALFPLTDGRYSNGPSMSAIQSMADLFFQNGFGFSSSYSPAKISTRMESYYYPPFVKAGGYVLPDVAMESQLKYLNNLKEPVLILNGVVHNRNWDMVNSDEKENMRLAMTYLTERGHRRIFYLNTYPDDPPHYSIADRLAGYLDFCKKNGLPVLKNPLGRTTGTTELVKLMVRQKATAVVAYNYFIACDFLHAAWELGYRSPEHFSIIAFNDNDLMRFVNPPLTCLNPAGPMMGARAAEILMARISGSAELQKTPIYESFPGTIIERESIRNI